MITSIGGACKQNGTSYIGDKETVAVRESYSSIYFESLAEISTYAYGHTVRVWYTKLYHTCMVHTIRVWYIPYAYGMYHTRMV